MRERDRVEISILYAFCRGLDDAIDEAPDPECAAADLDRVLEELRGLAPPRPLVAALDGVRERAGFGLDVVERFVAGVRADLEPAVPEDDDDLVRYAYDVSATVGLMIYDILGIAGEAARWRAVDLGIALQLSDVALDVATDAARGRVYVPATRLRGAGLDADAVRAGAGGAPLRRALAGLLEAADRYYASATQGIPDVPLRYRHGLLLVSRIWRAAGLGVAGGRGAADRPWRGSVALGFLDAARLALTPSLFGARKRRPHDPSLHRAIAGMPGTNPAARVLS